MEKHYTPAIEEFHVGFEYEALWGVENINGEWLKETFTDECSTKNLEEVVRVKCLDKEDIETLGWKEVISDLPLTHNWFKSIVYEFRFLSNPNCQITFGNDGQILVSCKPTMGGPDLLLFFGKIKNKSELKKLMQQLQIL